MPRSLGLIRRPRSVARSLSFFRRHSLWLFCFLNQKRGGILGSMSACALCEEEAVECFCRECKCYFCDLVSVPCFRKFLLPWNMPIFLKTVMHDDYVARKLTRSTFTKAWINERFKSCAFVGKDMAITYILQVEPCLLRARNSC